MTKKDGICHLIDTTSDSKKCCYSAALGRNKSAYCAEWLYGVAILLVALR